MIAHVVLFRPKADLAAADRENLAGAFVSAACEIPVVRRARVGRRVRIGRAYEQLMRTDFPYAAILEFDDLSGLRQYLEHPSHETLATRFFAAFEEALMYDYDLRDGLDGVR